MLKLQYFGHLLQRAKSLEKTLMLEKTEGEGDGRGCNGWMAINNSMDIHEFEQAVGDDGQGSLVCCSPWGHKEVDTTERLDNIMLNSCTISKFNDLFKDIPYIILYIISYALTNFN